MKGDRREARVQATINAQRPVYLQGVNAGGRIAGEANRAELAQAEWASRPSPC